MTLCIYVYMYSLLSAFKDAVLVNKRQEKKLLDLYVNEKLLD